jgi:hypothetical protein
VRASGDGLTKWKTHKSDPAKSKSHDLTALPALINGKKTGECECGNASLLA